MSLNDYLAETFKRPNVGFLSDRFYLASQAGIFFAGAQVDVEPSEAEKFLKTVSSDWRVTVFNMMDGSSRIGVPFVAELYRGEGHIGWFNGFWDEAQGIGYDHLRAVMFPRKFESLCGPDSEGLEKMLGCHVPVAGDGQYSLASYQGKVISRFSLEDRYDEPVRRSSNLWLCVKASDFRVPLEYVDSIKGVESGLRALRSDSQVDLEIKV